MPVDSESCELLRAIARSADAKQVHRLAVNVRDWDSLLGLAQEHRVVQVLYSRLADMNTAVPPAIQESLRTQYQRNVFHSVTNAAELIEVLKIFDREMIPVMPFKGIVLGASIYHDITARAAGDLDLLIDQKHLIRATNIILERGYELTDPTRAEYHFERQTDGMILELRWQLELTQPRFKRDLGLDWVWSRRRTAIVAGAEVPDMSPEITLLVLCMHGSRHVWSRLLWICDVAQLLNSSPDLNWQEVIQEARKSGLWRALALGVLLARRIIDVPVPESVLRRFKSDTTVRKLALYIQENLFVAAASVPKGPIPYSIQLLGFRDRVRAMFSLDFLEPNERDRAVVALPNSLRGFYYLIRPFRLFWDRSGR